MNYSKLTWYDLNEIWACLHHQIDKYEKMLEPDMENMVINSRIESCNHTLDKINSVMKALNNQETNQSDYELRIVSRVDNTVK